MIEELIKSEMNYFIPLGGVKRNIWENFSCFSNKNPLQINGGSLNFNPIKALGGAIGETFERSALYEAYNSVDIKREKQVNKKTEKWISFIQDAQNKGVLYKIDFSVDDIGWIRGLDLINLEEVFIPRGVVSLNHSNFKEKEKKIFQFSDSCGSGVHNSGQNAFEAAFSEFIERQTFLISVLCKTYFKRVNIEEEKKHFYFHESFLEAYRQLINFGDIFFFDISVARPGYVVLAIFSSDTHARKVHYSIGCAFGVSLEEATINAFRELIQGYEYLYKLFSENNNNSKKEEDCYKERFIQANKKETIEFFKYLFDIKYYFSPFRKKGLNTPLTVWQYLTKELFIIPLASMKRYYPVRGWKIFSPNGFWHMNPKRHMLSSDIFLKNLQSNSKKEKKQRIIKIERSNITLPFP